MNPPKLSQPITCVDSTSRPHAIGRNRPMGMRPLHVCLPFPHAFNVWPHWSEWASFLPIRMTFAPEDSLEYSQHAIATMTTDEGFLSMDESSFNETSKHFSYSVFSPNYGCGEQPMRCICANCGEPIRDRHFLLADGQYWHTTCLRCALCDCELQWQTSCFHHRGKLFCRQDYANCTTCLVCERRFRGDDLVVSLRTGLAFHVECLRCKKCAVRLRIGDRCFLDSSGVCCLLCHEQKSPEPKRGPITAFQTETDTGLCVANSNSANTSSASSAEATGEEGARKPSSRAVKNGSSSSENPHKRIRTSFKHDQLRLMKAYFKVNPNPDSKELRQLSTQTNLSKRVLQVWFQNARAKHRRWNSSMEIRGTGEGQSTTNSSLDLNQSTSDIFDDIQPITDCLHSTEYDLASH